MLELTTGVALLASTLYMSGSPAIAKNSIVSNTAGQNQIGYATTTTSHTIGPKQVEAYLRTELAGEPLLIEVARCESAYRQFDAQGNILRGKVNKADVGVMQINEKYHAEDAVKLGLNIYTMEGNVAFGKYLYKKYGAQPWTSSSACWAGDIAMK